MAKKTVGFIELEWTCPNCNNRNKGSQKTCSTCGAAQPADVEFHEPVRQELIKDTQVSDAAKAGPDIHCAYCGARNPATAITCSNCGGNLSEGVKREAGKVVGAFKPGQPTEILCPACGASNPSSELRCKQCGAALAAAPQGESTPQGAIAPTPTRKGFLVWIPILAVAGIGIILFLVLLFQQKDVSAAVSQRLWERTLAIEQFGPVEHANWRSDLPVGAAIVSCEQEHRSTSNDPVAGAREVCGTPYTVDKGSGYGEVVSDCVYEVYEDYCKYNVDEWSALTAISASGQDGAPAWPSAQLEANQRTGNQTEHYRIIFEVNGDQKTYETTDEQLYNQAVVGSQWNLTLNGLGQIIDLQLSN